MNKDLEEKLTNSSSNNKPPKKVPLSHETPFFSIFPDIYFKVRSFILAPFHYNLFHGFSLGFLLFQLSLLGYLIYFTHDVFSQDVWDVAEQ